MLILTWKITLMKIGSIKTVLWSKASKTIASPYFILLAATILCYFDVATFQHPLKWDIIDLDLPLRYFVSDCIQNGIFPYWNPYQSCGYPNYAIPITWYPTVWIFSLMGHYGIVALTIDFLLHIYIAGIGMFLLARRFGYSDATGCILGICYLACGFFVGNAQHFGWVIGAAWIPFLFAYFMDFSKNPKDINNHLKLILVSYFIATGAYPAIIFLSGYIVLFMAIYYCLKHIQEQGYKGFLTYSSMLLILSLFICIISLIAIVPTLQSLDVVNRDMSLDYLLHHLPQPVRGMISLMLPYAVIGDNDDWTTIYDFFGTDANSMMNVYFGLFTLFFFAIAVFKKKNAIHRIFLYTGFVYLLACFPHKLPIREFMIRYIPTMDLFRIPSVYRLFFIIACLAIAGIALDGFIKTKNNKRLINIIATVALVSMFTLSMFSFHKTNITWQHIAIQSIIQCCLIGVFILFNNQEKIPIKYWLVGLVLIDLSVATQMNGGGTIFHKPNTTTKVLQNETSFPKTQYPATNEKPIIATKGHGFSHYWRNTNTFMKDFSAENYSPYYLKSFTDFEKNDLLYKETLDNNIAFLSTNVFATKSVKDTALYSNDIVFADLPNFEKYSPAENDSTRAIEYLIAQPDQFEMKTSANYPQILTLLQNHHKGWHAYIDGNEVPVYIANISFMAVEVPSGNHYVHFVFKNNLIVTLSIISLVSFLICVLLLLFNTGKKTILSIKNTFI